MLDPSDLRVVICSRKPGFARTLRTALYGTGLRGSHIVSDPLAAVRAVAGHEAHALIAHVDTPEHDIGISLIRFMRRWERSPDSRLPIVAASDKRDFATVTAVLNAGANEFAAFPIAGDMLLKKLMAAMTSQRPFIETPGYVGPCRRRRDIVFSGPERRKGAVVAVSPESIEMQSAAEPSAA